jgi:hypothetical protein
MSAPSRVLALNVIPRSLSDGGPEAFDQIGFVFPFIFFPQIQTSLPKCFCHYGLIKNFAQLLMRYHDRTIPQ